MAPPDGIDAAPLTDSDRRDWLRLARSDGVGPITFRALLARHPNAADALAALPGLAARGGRHIEPYPADQAEAELGALADIGGRLVALPEPCYPPWLRQTEGAPPLLAVLGPTACLTRPMIAIVGARDASAAGRKLAAMLAEGLSTNGFVVASGLARGIDAAAHRAALTRGTVAVFAGGLDRVYPPEHADLARAIVEAGGALVSEMPLGWTARGRDFPRRNRIISGLAMGTVVVEAARRSGSLITGRRAAEQGRAVFAVPGSPLDPRAYGTNLLIKDGAQIVTDVDDIVATVRPMIGEIAPPDAPRFDEPSVAPDARPDIDDPDRDRVLEALGPAPIEVDTIVRATGIPAAAVNVILLELDLAGRLERHAGGRVSLA